MFKKILLTLSILILTYSFSQSNISNIQQDKKIELLSKKVDSLIAKQNEIKTKVLENRITQATETITNQNSIISSFGNIYTVITIIIALIGVALPILTYQFGIKPSKDALKEFEEKSDAKFGEFLKENIRKQTQNAVEGLNNEDDQVKNKSLEYLLVNKHNTLTKEQIANIIDTIINNNDEIFTLQLLTLIPCEKNSSLKEYFINYLKTSRSAIKIAECLTFFSNYNYFEFKDPLKTFITNNGGVVTFSTICTYFADISKVGFIELLNDKSIIDTFSKENLTFLKSFDFGSNDLERFNLNTEEYQATYLFEKLNGIT